MGWFSKSSKDEQPAPASQPMMPAAPADRRHEAPAPAAPPAGSSLTGAHAGAGSAADAVRPGEAEVTRVSSLASVLTSALGSPRQAEQASPAPASVRSSDRQSVFAESVDIEGSLEGEGDVLLRGRVHGSIVISGTLVIAETGRVQADVSAREVVNAGTVEGNIQAVERVRVQATGLVQGNIDSPSVVIDDGGGVEGYVQMGAEQPDDDEVPARSRQAMQPMPAANRVVPAPVSAHESSGNAGLAASSPGSGDGSTRGWDAQPPSAPTASGSTTPAARPSAPAPPIGASPAAQVPEPQPPSATLPPAATLPASTAGVALPPTGPRPPSAGLLFRPATAPATAPAAAPSRVPIPAGGGAPASLAAMAAAAAAGSPTTTATPPAPKPATDDPFADLESPTAPEPPGTDDVPIL